jgi:hypothetical protein
LTAIPQIAIALNKLFRVDDNNTNNYNNYNDIDNIEGIKPLVDQVRKVGGIGAAISKLSGRPVNKIIIKISCWQQN